MAKVRQIGSNPFSAWVCEEVLPSIRKFGAYFDDATLEELLDNPDKINDIIDTMLDEAFNNNAQKKHQSESVPEVPVYKRKKKKKRNKRRNKRNTYAPAPMEKIINNITNNYYNIYTSDDTIKRDPDGFIRLHRREIENAVPVKTE